MKRQFDYTVGPGPDPGAVGCNAAGGTLAARWRNDHIFERYGDDNTVYFTDYVEQSFLSGGPSPWNTASSSGAVLRIPTGQRATTFLCEESQNVKRTLQLEPGSSVKIFVDAWEHYQTVPLIVQVGSTNAARIPYKWTFFNYSPIGGSPVEGQGVASPCGSAGELNLQPPIIQTLGHTNRTPMGEFPASEESKQKTCCCAWDRPFLVLENHSSRGDLLAIVKIAQ